MFYLKSGGESALRAAECLCFTLWQSVSATPGPTHHNIYSSQAANAAPLLLSQFKHSISLTSLGHHTTHDRGRFKFLPLVKALFSHFESVFESIEAHRAFFLSSKRWKVVREWRMGEETEGVGGWLKVGYSSSSVLLGGNVGLAVWLTTRNTLHIAEACAAREIRAALRRAVTYS